MKKKIIPAVLLAAFLLAAKSPAPAVWLSGFMGPENLVFDKSGTLYVTDTKHLWKVTPDKKMEQLYTLDPKQDRVSMGGLVLTPDGTIFFSGGSRILKRSPDGKISEYAKGFTFANGMAMDTTGNIYVTDSYGRKLMAVTPDGKTKVIVKGEGSLNGLRYQAAANRLYFTSMFSGKVEYVDLKPGPAAGKPVVIVNLGFGLDDMALAPNGNLYVCQYSKGKVVKVTPNGKTEVIAEGINGPSSAAFGVRPGDTNTLYILEKGPNLRFNGTSVLVQPL